MHGVVDAVLLLLDLDLGRAANADDRDAPANLARRSCSFSLSSSEVVSSICALIWAIRASMSFFDQAPSMIVVFSFSMRTRLALPSI
jgi:hypothetical protein